MIDCRRMKIKNRTLHKKREERGTLKFKRARSIHLQWRGDPVTSLVYHPSAPI